MKQILLFIILLTFAATGQNYYWPSPINSSNGRPLNSKTIALYDANADTLYKTLTYATGSDGRYYSTTAIATGTYDVKIKIGSTWTAIKGHENVRYDASALDFSAISKGVIQVVDTTALKLRTATGDTSAMVYLKQLASGNTTGSGWFVEVDSSQTEDGFDNFDNATAGKQWRRITAKPDSSTTYFSNGKLKIFPKGVTGTEIADSINKQVSFSPSGAPFGKRIDISSDQIAGYGSAGQLLWNLTNSGNTDSSYLEIDTMLVKTKATIDTAVIDFQRGQTMTNSYQVSYFKDDHTYLGIHRTFHGDTVVYDSVLTNYVIDTSAAVVYLNLNQQQRDNDTTAVNERMGNFPGDVVFKKATMKWATNDTGLTNTSGAGDDFVRFFTDAASATEDTLWPSTFSCAWEWWINVDNSFYASKRIFNSAGDAAVDIYTNSSGHVQVDITEKAADGGTTVSLNSVTADIKIHTGGYHHVLVVRDVSLATDSLYLYINGTKMSQVDASALGDIYTANAYSHVGRNSGNTSYKGTLGLFIFRRWDGLQGRAATIPANWKTVLTTNNRLAQAWRYD